MNASSSHKCQAGWGRGEAAVEGCGGILTASASHSRCTCFNVALVPLPSAQLPCGASRATCWPTGPLQRPLRAPGRFASKLPGWLWATKRRWISCAVKRCSQVPRLRRVSVQSGVSFGKGTEFRDLLQFPKLRDRTLSGGYPV